MLLDKEADINKANHNGNTALIKASEHGQLEIVTVLVAAGADVHKTNDDGRSAFDKTCTGRFAGRPVDKRNKEAIQAVLTGAGYVKGP